MKLDLDELLQEIHTWKNLLKRKDDEIEILRKQLSFSLKQNEALELTRSSMLGEVSELNNAVASIRNSFKKVENFEEDRRNLLDENQILKKSIESLEKLYCEKNKSLNQELKKIKEANRDETSKLVSQIKNEASKQLDNFKEELEKKENDIKELKIQMAKLLEERNQDILKMKIQYENKIVKLKQQMPKCRIPTAQGLQMHDIFRQKYLKLEKNSEEEIAKLKEQVQNLQQIVESFRFKGGSTSLTSALLATNKPNVSTTAEVATQTESAFVELSRQFILQPTNDSDDFVTEKRFNKTQSVVLPQKRKLFNLNENYYIK